MSRVPKTGCLQVLGRRSVFAGLLVLLILTCRDLALGQRALGEIRISVRDPQGAAVSCNAELVSEANQFRRGVRIGDTGQYVAQELPFGLYRLTVRGAGFAEWNAAVQVRSEVPVQLAVSLTVAPVRTHIDVEEPATLVDPERIGSQYTIGNEAIAETIPAQPGRTLTDVVNDLPGWIYEANGVLHPRGSEYDVQYVVDGVPLTENHSPAFAPVLDASDVDSIRVLTANYPAEYGRKLGGIIEVTTKKDLPHGLHGSLATGGGSFSSATGSGAISYAQVNNDLEISGFGFHTDRYLDPPVLENFTNTGNACGISAAYERELSDGDRIRFTGTHSRTRFLVPNYLVQQDAGQRQNIADTESSGQLSFLHLISPDLLLSASASVRDVAAELTSNQFSTPVIVFQDRGYRDGYARFDLTGHNGNHNWKVGVDSIFNSVHEKLQYAITDPTQFDPGTQQRFHFSDRSWDIEPSAYAQDEMHFGDWNLSAGLRFDHYAFVVHESALSPRVGVSRYIRSANLVLHASYDRVFQTPAVENLLLASSPQLDSLDPTVLRLPVRPARGNFYEGGLTKGIRGKVRVDVNVFRRDFRNYSDDDVLLDTGVSFPIAFASARIIGEELRVAVPNWRRWSGFVSYTNQSGIGHGPITGGLFLGSEAQNLLASSGGFAVTQDQRNTARAQIHFQGPRRTWLALSAEYGSGLPAEVEDADPKVLLAQYGEEILSRVNLEQGRVRPSFSLDAAAGAELYRKEQRSASFQIQLQNLTDRVNVLNFASVFSGTAVAVPRSLNARVQVTF